MRYDAVIFDLFGTLVDHTLAEELQRCYAAMAAHVGTTVEVLRPAWQATRPERDRGRLGDTEAEIAHVCRALGLDPSPEQVAAATEARLGFYRLALRPRVGAVDVLTALRAIGLRTGLLSDCGTEVPHLWPGTPFAPLIDATVFSCAAGLCKPDPQIYQLICERLGVAAERCLYVGDGGSRELTGAARMGMQPVLIRVEGDTEYDPARADAQEWQATGIARLDEVLVRVVGDG